MIDVEVDPMAAADAAWQAQARTANGHARADHDGEPKLDFTIASTLADRDPPDRPWLVQDWLPRGQVTLLTGDGGTGKSLLAMQLQIACASGTPWLGLHAMTCPSSGLYAEDDDDELHRRLKAVSRALDINVASLARMAWRSAVTDPCELVELDEHGQVRPTAYYRMLEKAARTFCSRLVVLDAATNLYGGDEIRRRQVNGFITLLRRLAIQLDAAVLLLAHPSNQGISTGTGLSGSTHWNNAVRSRLYFVRATGDDADPDERVLTRSKANYAGAGEAMRVRWSNGAFIPIEPPTGLDRAAVSAKAERVFLALLSETYSTGSWTSSNISARNYAPSVFARHLNREGLGKPAFEGAMHRLIRTEQVKTETYGRPSNPVRRLVLA